MSVLDRYEPADVVPQARLRDTESRLHDTESRLHDTEAGRLNLLERGKELELQAALMTQRVTALERQLQRPLLLPHVAGGASRGSRWDSSRMACRPPQTRPTQRGPRVGFRYGIRQQLSARRGMALPGLWISNLRDRRPASPSHRAVCLGRIPIDQQAAALTRNEIADLDAYGEESLEFRRLSWHERQSVLECDAVLRLRKRTTGTSARSTNGAGGARITVDARCLQDGNYTTRGVGRHARFALEALRTAAPEHAIVAWTTSDLPGLDAASARFFDDVVTTPADASQTMLFVELSPMTASCAPAVPFLADPSCRTAALVYDFIPTRYPDAYLRLCRDALSNRARLEALARYDLLLPISNATLNDASPLPR